MTKFNPYKPYEMDSFAIPISQMRKLRYRKVVSPAWSHRLVRGRLTPGARLLAPLLYCFSDEPLKLWKPWKNKQAGVRLS